MGMGDENRRWMTIGNGMEMGDGRAMGNGREDGNRGWYGIGRGWNENGMRWKWGWEVGWEWGKGWG